MRKLYFSSLVNAHAQLSSGIRYLILGLNLFVNLYYMCIANGEGSGETARMHTLI